jgi:hypothetical protein
MIQFPSSTRKGIRLPKESFYTHATLTPAIKRAMVDDIEQIVWSHTLTAETLNVNASDKVRQIDVLTVTLKKREYNEKIFEMIEKAIPRHILFILRFKNECRFDYRMQGFVVIYKVCLQKLYSKYCIQLFIFTLYRAIVSLTLLSRQTVAVGY